MTNVLLFFVIVTVGVMMKPEQKEHEPAVVTVPGDQETALKLPERVNSITINDDGSMTLEHKPDGNL